MPNSATRSSAVETATKCFAVASSRAARVRSMAPVFSSELMSQFLAMRAFVIVSSVVKVFDATMNSTVSGSTSLVFSYMSVGSMFET